MTITEFLLARIAEDEAVAHNVLVFRMNPRTNMPGNQAIPARVLAECAAKRAIVAEHGPQEVASLDRSTWGQAFIVCRVCAVGVRQIVAPCPTARALAAVYADHPDWRQEWAQ